MKRLLAIALPFALLVGLAVQVAAVTTVLWKDESRSDFEKGTFKQVALTATGHLRPSNAITPAGKLSEPFVWCLAPDPNGNIVAGTGNQGTIYRIAPDGTTSVLHKSSELHVHALAIDKKGNIYAGTSPHGIILKISPDGKAATFYDAKDEYIWCLALSADQQHLYAGTGPNGHLLKIGMDGKGKVLFDSKQSHILCMVMDDKGNLYSGSAPDGIVYRTSPDGHTSVVYDAEEDEIHSLTIDHMGNVYAGTADAGGPLFPPIRSRSATRSGLNADKSGKKALDSEADKKAVMLAVPGRSSVPRAPIGMPTRPPKIGPNTVYKISPDGRVTDFVEFEKSMVTSLAVDKDFLYIGTGDKGRLYKVALKSDKKVDIVMSDEQKYILSILPLQQGLAFSTGTPGSVQRFAGAYARKGTFESRVCDAKGLARWGRLSTSITTPKGTSISIATRTGNSEKPDNTWSDWSKEHGSLKAPGFLIPSPPGRYIQYRATFKTGNRHVAPELSSVTLAYLPINNAPEVSDLTIDGQSKSKTSKNKGNSKTSRTSSASNKNSSDGVPEHKMQRTVTWKASDPDGDDISCNLSYKATDETAWKPLKKDLTKSPFKHKWDTLTVPDGEYQVKVSVSDAPSNPPEKALTDEELSEPFVIDNTRPVVQVAQANLQKDRRCIVKGRAVDRFSNILTMSYSVNAGDWVLVYPIDEIFDTQTEPFTFTTAPLPKGENTIVVKAIDAVGNIGCGKVVIKVK
ncbi:MAG: hypothetical protein GXP25_21735 [Planctomycetes bacterium]|nr:hypothetical protein [Planctomycetota bacterium]